MLWRDNVKLGKTTLAVDTSEGEAPEMFIFRAANFVNVRFNYVYYYFSIAIILSLVNKAGFSCFIRIHGIAMREKKFFSFIRKSQE